jgi:hypothetical protein
MSQPGVAQRTHGHRDRTPVFQPGKGCITSLCPLYTTLSGLADGDGLVPRPAVTRGALREPGR